jgi:hypothetical protein
VPDTIMVSDAFWPLSIRPSVWRRPMAGTGPYVLEVVPSLKSRTESAPIAQFDQPLLCAGLLSDRLSRCAIHDSADAPDPISSIVGRILPPC